MKYGIVISVSKTKFGPVVFKENLKENIIKAASMGYGGVELAIRKPESLDIREVKCLLGKYNLKVISLGTGQIYGKEGLSFSDPDDTVRRKAVDHTKKIIDIASRFNASIIIGLIRGSIKSINNYSVEIIKAEDKIAGCLESLMSYSKANPVNFLIEPINRYEVNIFNRLEDVKNFILKYKDRLNLNKVGILADTFHMNIEEPVIEESFEKYFNFIKHVHFADSNRWPPGYGHIDFKKIIKLLKEKGYDGFISFETLPLPDPETAARNAIEFIKRLESKII